MRRLSLALMILVSSAYSQQARFDGQALGPKGPLPNVIVSLCSSTATGIPCSPQTTSTTDSTGSVACSLGAPVVPAGGGACSGTTDALGNFGFWLTPGAYQYCLTGPGITGKCYQLTSTVMGATSSGGVSLANINNTIWLDGVKYTSLAAAVTDACAISGGGTVVVPPNWTDPAWSADLTVCTGLGILFMPGSQTFPQGTHSVVGTNVRGVSFVGLGSRRQGASNPFGPTFTYTGTGNQWNFTGTTSTITVKYIHFDLSGAGDSANGISFDVGPNDGDDFVIEDNNINGNTNGTNAQKAIVCNGCVAGRFLNNRTVNVNRSIFMQNSASGGTSSADNFILGGQLVANRGTTPTSIELAGNAQFNEIHYMQDGNSTVAVKMGASTSTNVVYLDAGSLTVTDSGTQNTVIDPSTFRVVQSGAIDVTEGTAPSGAASHDKVWADSTAHRFKMNNNNGGALTIAATSGDTFTSTTLTSPVINGSPTGTGIPTLTQKKGSGGGNYGPTASTTYVVVDSTNLCYTVTIPTGWKLQVTAVATGGTNTAAVAFFVAITDNAACSTANAGIVAETATAGPSPGANNQVALTAVINGDGASHNVALQFKTTAGADTLFLSNTSATFTPYMTFNLSPSN